MRYYTYVVGKKTPSKWITHPIRGRNLICCYNRYKKRFYLRLICDSKKVFSAM